MADKINSSVKSIMCVISKNCLLIHCIAITLLITVQPVTAETSPSQSPESVLLLIGEEQDLTGCELLGKVSGDSQESGDKATYPERLIIARNNLRDATAKLGGNAVHVLQTNNITRFEVPGADKKIFFAGNAYLCK